jgi:hypothetical protein
MHHKLSIEVSKLSDRPNHLPGEGGALNAGYTTVDGLARISNTLGHLGLQYGRDFYWKSFEYSIQPGLEQMVVLTFEDKDAMLSAKLAIESFK